MADGASAMVDGKEMQRTSWHPICFSIRPMKHNISTGYDYYHISVPQKVPSDLLRPLTELPHITSSLFIYIVVQPTFMN